MRIALITDTHWGARNDSLQFIEYYGKFYNHTFFPILEKEGIDNVIMLGDIFDRRKYTNHVTLHYAKKIYFDELYKRKIKVHVLVGNHDTAYKNTNDVNSVDLLLAQYNNIQIISSPKTITIDDIDICMMPWICSDNYEQSMAELENTSAQICMGHFEIDGFVMHRGMVCEDGLNPSLFSKFDMTFSGHYHHKSNNNDIYYLGNPYQLNWMDYGDTRGFHLFNLQTRELEFIENTNVMFHKIAYNDLEESITEIANKDLSKYTNTYVKVVVINKTNPYMFDRFIENLYKVNPIDITIAEDFTDLTEGVDDDILDQAEDTLTVLNKFVDNIQESTIDNGKLKTILRELYVEALNNTDTA